MNLDSLHNPPSVASVHRDLLLRDEESNLGLFSHAFANRHQEVPSPVSINSSIPHSSVLETRDDDTVTIMPMLHEIVQSQSDDVLPENEESGTCSATCDRSMNEATSNKEDATDTIIAPAKSTALITETNHGQHLEIDLSYLNASHANKSSIVSLYQCQTKPATKGEELDKKLERVFCGELNLDQSRLSCLHHTQKTTTGETLDHYHLAHEYGYVLQVDGHDDLIVVPYSTQQQPHISMERRIKNGVPEWNPVSIHSVNKSVYLVSQGFDSNNANQVHLQSLAPSAHHPSTQQSKSDVQVKNCAISGTDQNNLVHIQWGDRSRKLMFISAPYVYVRYYNSMTVIHTDMLKQVFDCESNVEMDHCLPLIETILYKRQLTLDNLADELFSHLFTMIDYEHFAQKVAWKKMLSQFLHSQHILQTTKWDSKADPIWYCDNKHVQ